MKTLKLTAILIIHFQLLINNCYAQTPVDSVGSGCALDFDGVNDYVEISDNSSIDITSDFSLEAWVLLKDLGASPNYYGIISKGGSGESSSVNHNYCLAYQVDTWVTGFNFISFFEDPFGSNYWVSYTIIPDLNRWYHLAATFNQVTGEYKLYLDGILVGTSLNVTGTPNIQNQPLMIGNAEYNVFTPDAKHANAIIDEVRIWNYARTQTEIQRDMCRKLTGNEPGLVGYWRFDDCGGLTATDASGNGNNGTLN